MNDWIKILLPGLLTVILNIAFYLLIRRWVEKSMEKFKIAYSGVFSEKIRIYQELLKRTTIIKRSIRKYSFDTDKQKELEVEKDILDFIDFVESNEPFISIDLIDSVKNLYQEYRDIFTPLFLYERDTKNEPRIVAYRESIKKIQRNEAFKGLEEKIINEMRRELKTDNP